LAGGSKLIGVLLNEGCVGWGVHDNQMLGKSHYMLCTRAGGWVRENFLISAMSWPFGVRCVTDEAIHCSPLCQVGKCN